MRHLTLLLFSLLTLSALAQIEDAKVAINEYRFFDAQCILNEVKEGDSLYAEAQAIAQSCKVGESSMNAIERVTFIDSLCVPAATWMNLWRNMPLSPRCGTLGTTTGGILSFTPELADRTYTSIINRFGMSKLSVLFHGYNGDPTHITETQLLDREREDESRLPGLLADDVNETNPFVLTDGTTLYFAAQGPQSMGGYDIFMTRYDTEERRFLKPQNIGMPFNSPANDLFYAVDEENNIGWLVTDRNMPADTVCIFSFIPNTVRTIYDPNLYAQEELTALARIDSIPLTQTDSIRVSQATLLLNKMREKSPKRK